MEAAAIAWRPLGRLLVEQGLLTDKELEFALAKQQVTGKRLGETIVECGFVSRPDLSNALAAQYGIELTTETGFGTGLRAQIQQRHESDRGRVIPIGDAQPVEPAVEIDAEPDETESDDTESPPPAETLLLAPLEEQWAKLAAAEEQLAELELELSELGAERERRRAQVVRLIQRIRSRDDELERRNEELRRSGEAVDGQADEQRAMLAAAEKQLAERERELAALTADRDRRRAQVVRFARRVRTRDDELLRLGEAVDGLRDQSERLAGDVRGCDAEIDRLRNENARGREQADTFAARTRELQRGRDEDPVLTARSHLVFLQLVSGYELVERDGAPPPRHSPFELPGVCDGRLVVAASRPSPFPGDGRPCIVVQPA